MASKTDDTIIDDPVAAAEEADEAAADYLAQLREKNRKADAEAQVAKAARDEHQATAERQSAARLAERDRLAQLAAARERVTTTRAADAEAAAQVEQLYAELLDARNTAVELVVAVAEAINARQATLTEHAGRCEQLTRLGEPTRAPQNARHVHTAFSSVELQDIARAALRAHPQHPALRGVRVPPPPLAW